MNKTIIIIAGPTASGKTALSIDLALHYNTSIISADSRQCFRELNIGVAKPDPSQLDTVPHYFINSHSIHQQVTAADFESYALQAAESIFRNNDLAIMVGGTGLYIKAFCEGLDAIPEIDPAIREHIQKNYNDNGIEWLNVELKQKDPDYFHSGEIHNPHRMMRALEVILSSGSSILSFRTNAKKYRDFRIIKFAIEIPRETLYQRINERVDRMMEAGLFEEALSLIPYRRQNALQTVGYKELFSHFDNEISLNKAIELIKQNSRNYAKRQMTWFKKDKEITWIKPNDINSVLNTMAGIK